MLEDSGAGQQLGCTNDQRTEPETAGESAVTPLVYVAKNDDVRHAAQLMAESGVSHLAVVDPAAQRPIGVISTLDIARAIAG